MQLTYPNLWRFLPLFHAVVFGATAVVGRILIARNRQHNAVSFSRGVSARDFVARCFYLWLPVIYGLFLAVYGLAGERGQPVMNLAGLEWIRWVGVACLVISLIWVVASQASMGAAWRMGVEADARTELITSGPFAVSRNPVYLGIRGTMLGQLLVVGTWPVLAIWAMSELLVQIQVRFEEEHMVRLHAQRYAEYCSRVRRWR
jgi:protein-S-isoprenylcysteine O-methyltransferase Ste14